MIRKIEGTNWSINTDILLYENPEVAGYFLTGANAEYEFENMDQLVEAIIAVKSVFVNMFGFDTISEKEIEIVYCRNCPICMNPNGGRIGLHRTGNTYIQDVYQFSHELFHSSVNGIIVGKFKWFEEGLCALSSLLVIDIILKKHVIDGIKDTKVLNSYLVEACIPHDGNEDSEKYICLYYYDTIMPREYVTDRTFEKHCAVVIKSIIQEYNLRMNIFAKLPSEEAPDFYEYMQMWRDKLPESQKFIAEKIGNIFKQ